MQRNTIRYCRACGSPVVYRLPDDGDTSKRAVCTVCATVHYENPLNVVGTLPYTDDGRVLLCQRAIEPRQGKWTLPAGFMELGETLEEGALRETAEEAGVAVELGELYALISLPQVGQVHFFYLARLQSERVAPGFETLEARLFSEADLPWDQLAFRTVARTLQHFFADQKRGAFSLYRDSLR